MGKIFSLQFLLIIALLFFIIQGRAVAGELTGTIGIEGSVFFNPPVHAGQEPHSGAVLLEPEYYHDINSTTSLTLALFGVYAYDDPERTHFDIREAFILKVFDSFEASIGIRKVFWGVTESNHLVDIINQTDLIEGTDGEDKLGQPMLSFSMERDFGLIDLYVMPFFRERTFPGREGRLRGTLVVDTDNPIYENSAEDRHTDLAARYSVSLGQWDIGLSHFWGTSREPSFILGLKDGAPVLRPYYEIINQSGLDLQLITGEWLWKMEAIHRSGQGESYLAGTAGVEYTFTSIVGTQMDLGLLAEWLYDERGDSASTPFANDAMAGMRLAVNDIASTELLAGITHDLESHARFYFLESSRRIGDYLKISVEAGIQDLPMTDPLYAIEDDDYAQATLFYYF